MSTLSLVAKGAKASVNVDGNGIVRRPYVTTMNRKQGINKIDESMVVVWTSEKKVEPDSMRMTRECGVERASSQARAELRFRFRPVRSNPGLVGGNICDTVCVPRFRSVHNERYHTRRRR
jgi:hypothetical protein